MNAEASLYETLEVSPRASAPVIKAAYRCLVQLHHPDKHDGNAVAAQKLVGINHAYEVLSDTVQRSRYDARRTAATTADRRGYRAGSRDNAGVPPLRAKAADPTRAGSRMFAFRPLD